MRDARPTQTPHNSDSRNAALRRLGRVNRWLLAGSAALTGAFTAVAASAFPGRAAKAGAVTGAVHRSAVAPRGSSHASRALEPPAEAPQATTTQEAATAPATTTQAAPAQETAPTRESSSAPTQEATPAQETPTRETSAAPAQETAPTRESTPVTSGGS
jgi:hypothetical protein